MVDIMDKMLEKNLSAFQEHLLMVCKFRWYDPLAAVIAKGPSTGRPLPDSICAHNGS